MRQQIHSPGRLPGRQQHQVRLQLLSANESSGRGALSPGFSEGIVKFQQSGTELDPKGEVYGKCRVPDVRRRRPFQ
jgi:hypothetical protein